MREKMNKANIRKVTILVRARINKLETVKQ
jgi:hypothetical protein